MMESQNRHDRGLVMHEIVRGGAHRLALTAIKMCTPDRVQSLFVCIGVHNATQHNRSDTSRISISTLAATLPLGLSR
jgi:hypothetical protein